MYILADECPRIVTSEFLNFLAVNTQPVFLECIIHENRISLSYLIEQFLSTKIDTTWKCDVMSFFCTTVFSENILI